MSGSGGDAPGRRPAQPWMPPQADLRSARSRESMRFPSGGGPSTSDFDPYNMPAPPLVRGSSASSITSLRRRREEHSAARTSRSESNLGFAADKNIDVDESSDMESPYGRRVRAKHANRPREYWDIPVSNLDRQPELPNVEFSPRRAYEATLNAWEAQRHMAISGIPGEGLSRSRRVSGRDLSQTRARRLNESTMGGFGADGASDPMSLINSASGNTGSSTIPDRSPVAQASSSRANLIRPRPESYSFDGTSLSAAVRSRASSISMEVSPVHPNPPGDQPRREIVLPRWQPDAEVTICPICVTQFSFFVRKHHCRKCGRVVCNSCSPHRIIIPYQFIVQPPEYAIAANSPPLDHARAGRSSSFTRLGGGARVRLCNPCVPDPNVAPPQTPEVTHNRRTSQTHSRSASLAMNSTGRPEEPDLTRPSMDISNFPRRARHSSILTGQRGASSSLQPTSNIASFAAIQGGRSRSSTSTSNQASGSAQNYHSLIPRGEPSSRPLPPRPRIAEEDECPICHHELPSRTLPNCEALREAHIIACIKSNMGSNQGQRVSRQSMDADAPPPPLQPRAESAPIRSNAASRQQSHVDTINSVINAPHDPVRVSRILEFPYDKATEKGDIEDQECTICMEDFEPNQKMGRLECMCKFHLKCIRGWFEEKNSGELGQCPVHQHY